MWKLEVGAAEVKDMDDETGDEVMVLMDEVRKFDCGVREVVERDSVGGEFDVATRDVETCEG